MCRLFSLEELKEATNNFDTCASSGEGSNGKVPSTSSKLFFYPYANKKRRRKTIASLCNSLVFCFSFTREN